LHPAQEEDEQPPQPELPDELDDGAFGDRPMPKRDRSFSVFAEPHFSQATARLAPKTSFSKSAPQELQ
jgi:hypothetical protein